MKEGERLEATVIEMDKGEIVTAYCLQAKVYTGEGMERGENAS